MHLCTTYCALCKVQHKAQNVLACTNSKSHSYQQSRTSLQLQQKFPSHLSLSINHSPVLCYQDICCCIIPTNALGQYKCFVLFNFFGRATVSAQSVIGKSATTTLQGLFQEQQGIPPGIQFHQVFPLHHQNFLHCPSNFPHRWRQQSLWQCSR